MQVILVYKAPAFPNNSLLLFQFMILIYSKRKVFLLAVKCHQDLILGKLSQILKISKMNSNCLNKNRLLICVKMTTIS